ncbi:RHO1 GDP-GTP exchange protein 2, partial [Cryomyces antarcticus]
FKETLLEETSDVNGVFTLLTECYSPTCTRDRLCYSIACPRRLEQQARLNIKPQPGLKREDSKSSLHDEKNDEQKLWINTVSKEVADSVGDKEKKRQEIISELMYTERDFVKDLEYLRDFWMKPLRSTNPATPSPIPEHRREKFVRTVFSNCQEVYAVNYRMAEALTRRQQENPIVRNIGDIFIYFVPNFTPFIKYGSNQLFGKYEFEKEKASNPAFTRFVDETERRVESRKLELNGYLTKPTTRLARYPLLLEGILKCTADDNPDKIDIPKAIAGIRDVLSRVNVESGKAENHFNLMQLNQQLKFRPGEYMDLKLTEETRQIVFKGALKKGPSDSGDIQAYLFDHAVLL